MKTPDEQLDEIVAKFTDWWSMIGSIIPPAPGENHAVYARRMAELAWIKGAQTCLRVTDEKQDL